LAFFAAMREFKRYLKSKNFSIHYIDLDDRENTQSLSSNLKKILNHYSVSRFEYIQPDEYRLDEQLRTFCQTLSTPSKAVSAEHFLTSRTDLQDHFKNKKSILMESFYRMMRKRFNILMENDSPAGGRWNYDSENRKKYDGDAQIPQPQQAAKAPPHRLCLPAVGQIFAKR
jgi:deoxyribodipyrimidine photolyase-related protein